MTKKCDIPFLCTQRSDVRNLLRHRSVPQGVFSAVCDRKTSMENHDTAAPTDEIFQYQFSLKHRRLTLRCFGTVCRINFAKKRATQPLPSILSISFSSIQESFWNTEEFPHEIFGFLRQVSIGKTMMLPLLCIKVLNTRVL